MIVFLILAFLIGVGVWFVLKLRQVKEELEKEKANTSSLQNLYAEKEKEEFIIDIPQVSMESKKEEEMNDSWSN